MRTVVSRGCRHIFFFFIRFATSWRIFCYFSHADLRKFRETQRRYWNFYLLLIRTRSWNSGMKSHKLQQRAFEILLLKQRNAFRHFSRCVYFLLKLADFLSWKSTEKILSEIYFRWNEAKAFRRNFRRWTKLNFLRFKNIYLHLIFKYCLN